MSALQRVREKFGTAMSPPGKASKPPEPTADARSAGFAGPQDERSQLFVALQPRIEEMAQRWLYTSDELAEVLELARRDPAKWAAAVTLDEQLCERLKGGVQ